VEPAREVEIAPEVKPTMRAYMVENLSIVLSALLALSAAVVDKEYMYYWYAGIASFLLLLAVAKKWRVLKFLVLPTVTAMLLYYFVGKLAAISVVVSIVEFIVFYDFVKSTSYRFLEDGVVIKVRSFLEEKTEKIPIDAIASISVESGFIEKMLGYADIHIELRSKKKIDIVGIEKDVAEKVSKALMKEMKSKKTDKNEKS